MHAQARLQFLCNFTIQFYANPYNVLFSHSCLFTLCCFLISQLKELFYFFVQSIGYGSCGWLINDAENVQACNGASVFGGLPLRVVEIGGYCDNCICYRLRRQENSREMSSLAEETLKSQTVLGGVCVCVLSV